MKKFLSVICLILLLVLALTAYGNNAKTSKQVDIKENSTLATGHLKGVVQSEIVDTNTCQLYLYDQEVSQFTDEFDLQHPNYNPPDAVILGTAPLASTTINSQGEYGFERIKIGTYKLVLNCITAKGVQDESLLTDDPIQYQGFQIPNPEGIIPNVRLVTIEPDQIVSIDFMDERDAALEDNLSEVTISADLTDPENYKGELYNMWNTVNRISPKNGVQVINGLNVNLVRMIGGINKKIDGQNVPDISYDISTFNENTQSYEYNFQPLLSRIDAVLESGATIHQIVMDQPPWAFQRGYNFIPDDQKDGINFRQKEQISHYGNSLPPHDKEAYNQFLQATMRELIKEYGKEKVLSWRFRIGTEIETPNHWFGTEQDFVEHFANSVNAIRAVLPDAKIGLHTRGPGFIYRNGTVRNYKNEPIKSFHNALIEYCFDNGIRYDFWGVSDYPFINNASTRDPKVKFKEFFEPLVTHPKWQKGSVIDIQEFSIITKMRGIPEAAFITSHSPQADSFFIALTDNFYQSGVSQVFQWGLREGEPPWRVSAFENMQDLPRIDTVISDATGNKTDTIGAIVVSDESKSVIKAITYHYDPKDLEAVRSRDVKLSFVVDAPPGTRFSYRTKLAGAEHHAFNNFISNDKAADWLKEGDAYDKYGDPNIVLNAQGKKAWRRYEHSNVSRWTKWQSVTTVSHGAIKGGSRLIIDSELPLFSFEKTEIKIDNQRK